MSGVPSKRRRLDSDDDDDEYVQPGRGSPLLQYAVTAALPTDELPLPNFSHNGVAEEEEEEDEGNGNGALSTPADRAAITANPEATPSLARPSHGAPSILATSSTPAPVVSGPPAVFDEDEDVPAACKGLFSTDLLNVLLVPLEAICKQSAMTDKLLAQYLPLRSPQRQDKEEGTKDSLSVLGSSTYHNAFGIAPGFRWDGVVRGRGPVD